MSVCTKCEFPFEKGDFIATCTICYELFHANKDCAGISAAEVGVFKLKTVKPMMVYRCKQCIENNNERPGVLDTLSEINSKLTILEKHETTLKSHSDDIIALKRRVEELEGRLSNDTAAFSVPKNDSGFESVQDAITEVQDRNKRMMNILLL